MLRLSNERLIAKAKRRRVEVRRLLHAHELTKALHRSALIQLKGLRGLRRSDVMIGRWGLMVVWGCIAGFCGALLTLAFTGYGAQ